MKTRTAWILTATLVGSTFVVGAGLAFMEVDSLTRFAEIQSSFKPSDQWLLDRSGEPLEQTRIDSNGRRLAWVKLDQVSPALVQQVLQAEDKRFFEHSGVDLLAIAKSGAQVIKRVVTSRSVRRGASTISMQLASMLSKDPSQVSGHRSVVAKLKQMRLAWALERSWTKPEILEAYLNLAHFRGEIQGVSAASHLLFAKDPHGLSREESALLAVLLSSPNASYRTLGSKLCRRDWSSCPAYDALIQEVEGRDGRDEVAVHLAPHAAKILGKLDPSSSLLRSTIDRDLQKLALTLAGEQLGLLKKQNVNDAAVLVVDNQTGQVLVYVGNVPGHTSASYIDGVKTRRQAGSTLKPFVYGLAFETGILKPNSLLADEVLEVDTGRGVYRPRNYDKRFRGVVTVRAALASSMNIPAVKTLELLGPQALVEKLHDVGFEDLNSGEDYGVSLALGTADVTLWELVRAYRVFANGGLYSDLRLQTGGRKPEGQPSVFSAKTAYRISTILSDREARSVTFGLENPLSTKFWTAVKTGTSKDMRDNWCVGFSSRYTVGVWVGNFSGESMWDVSGISGAAPIWRGLMAALHARETSAAPAMPLDSREELLSDSKDLQTVGSVNFRKILLPSTGSVMTTDPDIPKERQKILLQASGKLDRFVKWELNGKVLGRGDKPQFIELKPGKYTLKLMSRNRLEDESHFTVR